MGIDEHAKESATELSNLGYTTFVADIYGVGNKLLIFKKRDKKQAFLKRI